jgi:tripartite-type tricarboxylate transporter receptor subunit TctC
MGASVHYQTRKEKSMWSMKRVVLLMLICLFGQFSGSGWAQSYPTKMIRIIEPGSPGGGADTLMRVYAVGLAQVFGQQVVVDNRGGASGRIGAEIASKAPPDGYTLIIVNVAAAANVILDKKVAYDLVRDFSAVTQLAWSPHVVAVHPSFPAKSIKELVDLAKAKPGMINYAHAGVCSSTFLAAELFKAQAGLNMVNVSYMGGAQALTSVLAGETSVYFSPLAAASPHIQQGRIGWLRQSVMEPPALGLKNAVDLPLFLLRHRFKGCDTTSPHHIETKAVAHKV